MTRSDVLASVRKTEKVNFRTIKAEILRRIRDRTWAPGALLPGEIELALEFACARATVNRALRELSEEGIIDRRRKAGTRVRLSPVRNARFEIPIVRAEIEATGAAYSYALAERSIVPVPVRLRRLRDLPAKTRLLHLVCTHWADGLPYQHEDRWINIAAVPQVEQADFSVGGPNEWLVQAVPFTDAEISFSASAADAGLARFFGIAEGAPVFLAERSTWLDGRLVTHARLHFGPCYRMTTRY